MSRLERLVNLLAALIDTDRPLTRAQLLERVPGYPAENVAFRRAFERDKETLRNMGIPLVVELIDPLYPEAGEGYRIPRERYQLPDLDFTRDEMQALAMAASAVKLKSQAASAALWKLEHASTPTENHSPDSLEVVAEEDSEVVEDGAKGTFRPTTTTMATPVLGDVALPDDDELGVVFTARNERRTIAFTYRGRERRLDPYRLSFRNGHWYVSGFDHGHSDLRTYRLDRREGSITASEPGAFAAPAVKVQQPWLPPWQMGDEPPARATLLVDVDHADLARAHLGAAVIRTQDDGSIIAELDVTNREAFRSFVLGFLDHAEVLGPPELRDDMIDYLESMTRNAMTRNAMAQSLVIP